MLPRPTSLPSLFVILSAAAALLMAAVLVHFAIDPGAATADTTAKETAEKEETFDYKINGETKHGTRKVLTLDMGGGVTMEMVRIPHGKFLMGAPDSHKGEVYYPQHEVTITKDFYLGKYLVTQEQYKALMGENPSYFAASGPGRAKVAKLDTGRFPVEKGVSWDDAQAFCQKLSDKTHRKAGLPTEAQWEYACRAGTATPFPCGDELTTDDANFDKKLGRTSVVGSYPANPFGLYDMTGNLWEWCSDYYDNKYYANSPKEDPENLTESAERPIRGGSWIESSSNCLAAFRHGLAPTFRAYNLDFRVGVRVD